MILAPVTPAELAELWKDLNYPLTSIGALSAHPEFNRAFVEDLVDRLIKPEPQVSYLQEECSEGCGEPKGDDYYRCGNCKDYDYAALESHDPTCNGTCDLCLEERAAWDVCDDANCDGYCDTCTDKAAWKAQDR